MKVTSDGSDICGGVRPVHAALRASKVTALLYDRGDEGVNDDRRTLWAMSCLEVKPSSARAGRRVLILGLLQATDQDILLSQKSLGEVSNTFSLV